MSQSSFVEFISQKLTTWIGTPVSIVAHSIVFAGIFLLVPIGVPLGSVLLVLTTAVSLEAIYLAIFIQMTVNKTTASLAEVEEDIEDIQEDVEEIEEDVDEISKDVKEEDLEETEVSETLRSIELKLLVLAEDIQKLKKKNL